MNVELANRALDEARRHPERFDMDRWYTAPEAGVIGQDNRVPPCGTTACFAGWVAFLTAPEGTFISSGGLRRADGTVLGSVEGYAIKQLDISYEQSGVLFYLDTLEQVEKAVAYLADNPGADSEAIWRESGWIDTQQGVDF